MADGRKLTMMIVADVRSVQIQRQRQVHVVDMMEHVVNRLQTGAADNS